jgi:hypothetical protein
MKRRTKMNKNNVYWCCTADFGQHDADCKHAEHAPPSVEDPFTSSFSEIKLDTENQGLIEL